MRQWAWLVGVLMACAPDAPTFQPSSGGSGGQPEEGGAGGQSTSQGGAGQEQSGGTSNTGGTTGGAGGTPKAVAVDLVAGGSNTCARYEDGHVWCWGSNQFGQSALPITQAPLPPTEIPNLYGVTQLSLGLDHGCGLWGTEARCWGWNGCDWHGGCVGGGALGTGPHNYNADCQKSDPSCGSNPIPTGIASDKSIEQVQAGGNFSCAQTFEKELLCWGASNQYQLAAGKTSAPHPSPAEIYSLSGSLVKFAIGSESVYAARFNGSSLLQWLSWGWNGVGQLALDGTTLDYQPAPASIEDVKDCSSLRSSTTGEHVCGINDPTGNLWCWGHNGCGQLGTLPDSDCKIPNQAFSKINSNPTELKSLGAVKDFSLGFRFTCAISTSSKTYCWGDNSQGQLGQGIVGGGPLHQPQEILLPSLAVQIAAGIHHACARLEDHSVWCWGGNDRGQLGNNATVSSGKPLKVNLP